jgi:uncharacterized membrane protein YjjB (DUF3815 family)
MLPRCVRVCVVGLAGSLIARYYEKHRTTFEITIISPRRKPNLPSIFHHTIIPTPHTTNDHLHSSFKPLQDTMPLQALLNCIIFISCLARPSCQKSKANTSKTD